MRKIVILLSIAATMLFAVAAAEDQVPSESECVTFVTCPRGLSTSHCTPISFQFEAVNSHSEKPNQGIRYSVASGHGVIDERTGLWTFDPTTIDVQQWGQRFRCVIVATQGHGKKADTCKFSVRVYNNAPRPFLPGQYQKDSIPVVAGQDNVIPIWWLDRDSCDYLRKYLVSVDPSPDGLTWLTDEGNVQFYPKALDTGKFFTFRLMAHDGIDSGFLDIRLFVLAPASWSERYAVAIRRYLEVFGGQFVDVNVDLQKSSTDSQVGGLGGFDLLIGYDNTAISLQQVFYDSSTIFQKCSWEYFTYRFGANGNCTASCPSGLVRVIGIAETNNGAHHPTCPPLNIPGLPVTLFTLRYLVTNDPTYDCQYVPIRFFWIDCGDNSLVSADGSQLHIARRVFDGANYDVPVDSTFATFPGYGGVPIDSCIRAVTGRKAPARSIDFYNGGMYVICADSIDARGDINLNNIPFELADCVMFSNYFVYGLSAFGSDIPRRYGSIAASDINRDGITLTLADYVYMQHIIAGDANPVPPSPSTDTAHLLLADQTLLLATPDTLGALRLVFEGEVPPELLVSYAFMSYTSDTMSTTILISGSCESGATHLVSGPLLNGTAGHQLLSAEAATYEGGMIPIVVDYVTSADAPGTSNMPTSFALRQNYPNPFNAGTVISFDLPNASDVRLEVINIAGQVVHEVNRHFNAGSQTIEWDGASHGRAVASGIYYYRITAGDFTATKKMVLLK